MDTKDWDKRFWHQTNTHCLECLPTGLAAELRRMVCESLAPIGLTGDDTCIRCGGSRIRAIILCRQAWTQNTEVLQ
jgi:hypothetical protein